MSKELKKEDVDIEEYVTPPIIGPLLGDASEVTVTDPETGKTGTGSTLDEALENLNSQR